MWVPVDTGQAHGDSRIRIRAPTWSPMWESLRLALVAARLSQMCSPASTRTAQRVSRWGWWPDATAGIAQWCVEVVTEHLRTREQFGKVIGTFQALQHNAAMLLVNSELVTAAAWDAVRAIEESIDQHRIAAAAWGGDRDRASARSGARHAHHVRRHRLHLGTRSAPVLAAGHQPGRVDRRRQPLGPAAPATTCTQQRDMSVNLGDAEPEFRAWVAETLDAALDLSNDQPGRQGDYEDFKTGPQRTLIAEAGLIAPHWPPPWGIDAGPLRQLIIDDEFAKLVRPGPSLAGHRRTDPALDDHVLRQRTCRGS